MQPLVSLLARLRRAVWWHRRALAALSAAACLLCCLRVLSPTPPPTVPVVVATVPLAGGTTLTTAHVRVRHVPADIAPASAIADPGSLTGRTLAAPVPEGAILTEVSVVSPALAAAAPGRVLTPVRVADADVVSLVRVGDRVDVVSIAEGRSTIVATHARIVAIPRPTSADRGALAPSAGRSGTLIVLDVSREEAAILLGVQASGRIDIVLH